MWKKKCKRYVVNHRHEELMSEQAIIRNEWLELLGIKHLKECRLLMKWHAVDNDKRFNTDKEKDRAWCDSFGIV